MCSGFTTESDEHSCGEHNDMPLWRICLNRCDTQSHGHDEKKSLLKHDINLKVRVGGWRGQQIGGYHC